MQLTSNVLRIEPESIRVRIERFIKDYTEKVKAENLILGLSGGIDSAVSAALSVDAIGHTRVFSIYMPEKETQTETDHQHVKLIAKTLKLQFVNVNLTEVMDTLYGTIPDFNSKESLSKGNLKARMRMLILYYYANLKKGLVVGSSDKSEAMIGYFTKWGDGAADIAPLLDLYKTQIRDLAFHLKIPSEIVNKPSTPGLLPNQTAEKDLGFNYETLDLILYGLEHFMTPTKIAEQLSLSPKIVKAIKKRWLQNEHKRKMPLTTKLQYRTINADFRLNQESNYEGEKDENQC